MSADNWTFCPRCDEQRDAYLLNRSQEVAAAYGVMPVEEFNALRRAVDVEHAAERERTFREDYEFYGASTGEISADYFGACSNCGLSVDFKRSVKFWPEDPK